MKRTVFLAFVGALALVQVAGAQQINDPNQITLRHNFETGNVPPPGPFTLGNATFSESSTGTGGPGWRYISVWSGFGRQLTDNAGISDIRINFDTAMMKVGMDVGIGDATYLVEFFNGNTIVGAVRGATVGVDSHFFAGWQHNAGITSVRITEPSGENGRVGGIDDVRYDPVPEPATMTVMAVAGAFMAARRRRNRA